MDADDKSMQSVSRNFRGARLAVALAGCIQLYRLMTVVADNGETPFLGANDRSRWCTIAALIEDRSFIIDRLLEKRDKTGRKRTWYSIDMVRKPERDGSEHYYSSKPPLLAVIHAAVCSPLTSILNRRLTDAPLLVGRCLLGIVQLLPLLIFWCLAVRSIERHVANPIGRWILLIATLFGTFLSTFSNTLNNHLPAALCMIASVWLLERLFRTGPSLGSSMAIGFFAALTAAFELPALAWASAVTVLLTLTNGVRVAVWAGLGMVPVAVAFAVTNYIAYGDLQPPYAHREVLGARVASAVPTESIAPDQKLAPNGAAHAKLIAEAVLKSGIAIAEPYALKSARRADTWEFSAVGYIGNAAMTNGEKSPTSIAGNSASVETGKSVPIRFAVVAVDGGWSIHRWNDWYDYPKSYWLPGNKQGVDLGEPSTAKYAFHVLIGHHGIFSLTPFWILSVFGAVLLLRNGPGQLWPKPTMMSEADRRWWLAAAVVVTSGVCIAFYLARPLIDRNYGGVCSGFRWQFWLIPAWLWLASPAVEKLAAHTWGVVAMLFFLTVSIFSATYPWFNPWQHPWPYQWLMK